MSSEYFVSNNWIPIDNKGQPKDGVEVTIAKLTHVTHLENAKKIVSSQLEFKASPKVGKSRALSYKVNRKVHEEQLSQSDFERERYHLRSRVSRSQPLICEGIFSWWGIEVDPETSNNLQKSGYELSMLFTDESLFGTVGFSVPFDDVMESYKSSFKPGAEVLFKKAGTLWYTARETCYVILVCMKEEGKPDPLPQFSTVPEPYTAGSSVCITNPYKWIEGRGSVKWNQYVFAFYFPKSHETSSFSLRQCTVTLFGTRHSNRLCLRKINGQDCPDQCDATVHDLRSLKKTYANTKRCDIKHTFEIQGDEEESVSEEDSGSEEENDIEQEVIVQENLMSNRKRKNVDDSEEEDEEEENDSEEVEEKVAKKRRKTKDSFDIGHFFHLGKLRPPRRS